MTSTDQLPVHATHIEAWLFSQETVRRCDRAADRALGLSQNVWPWQWHRLIVTLVWLRREHRACGRRLEQSRAWRKAQR
jgi:hypothetical protein